MGFYDVFSFTSLTSSRFYNFQVKQIIQLTQEKKLTWDEHKKSVYALIPLKKKQMLNVCRHFFLSCFGG